VNGLASVVGAPAKLNLCLYVGGRREDGLHEIRSLFEPLELADQLRVSRSGSGADEVHCPGVDGPNLVSAALAALREAGWAAPPLRIEVEKRIPVAAGLGGGSADAAAVLRLARGEVDGIRSIAAGVGADVPSQVAPRPCLVAGAGEIVEPVPPPGEHALIVVPHEKGLSTAEVYAEADRLGALRSESELDALRRKMHDATLEAASPLAYTELLVNDLQPAALSLRPEISGTLDALAEAGAKHTMVTGSGPTAVGLFADRGAALAAAASLPGRGAIVTGPLQGGAS
jgi:4-diphosphocytidyl-2-C-methyl-D-erythritol kinase